jgi:hypothetical protein
VFAGGDFHEQGDSGGFLADTNLIDHHRNNERMSFREDCGEDEGGALRRWSVRRTREFADREILEIPLPTGHRASEAAEEAIGISGSKQLDGGADALAAGFEEPGFEKRESRDADGTKEPSHGGNHFGAARVSEQKCQTIEKTLWIALQEARERRVEGAIGESRVDKEHPAIVGDEAVTESDEVLVLGVARNAFEADENIFKTGEVAAGDSNAAESFEESGEKGAGFGAFFLG